MHYVTGNRASQLELMTQVNPTDIPPGDWCVKSPFEGGGQGDYTRGISSTERKDGEGELLVVVVDDDVLSIFLYLVSIKMRILSSRVSD